MSASLPRLRIAQVAPPIERVPPTAYGGTERVIDELARELARRGHEVVLFASGDSDAPGELAATVPVSLRADGFEGDPGPWFVATQLMVLARQHEFDLIHGHIEMHNLMLAHAATSPVVSTFHGRLDTPHARSILAHETGAMVAISEGQAADAPEVRWAGIVHNGLSLRDMPFGATGGDDLCFVGRFTPEKGLVEAIEVARLAGRRLRIAAKEPWLASEKRYHDDVFLPAAEAADIELLGELGPLERNALMASSRATLMPGDWPEPFGLTAIESMATGTPVICRPLGGLREIVRHGVDGFLASEPAAMAAAVDQVGGLDRAAIRSSVLERFSAERMADGYEAVYAQVLGSR